MKRTLIAMSVLMAVSATAFQRPAREPLPNFDRRTDRAAGVAARIAPQHEQAVADLKARVPQLEVIGSKVLGHPNFFSSRDGFLTGPNAEGFGVLPATAQAIPANDRHRAVKAFLNEHAALLGYGAEALNGARISREYVTAHNGLRTTIWQQELNGIPLLDCVTVGHISKNGELVNLYSEFVPDANAAAARGLKNGAVADAAASTRLSAVEALIVGAKNIGDDVTAASLTSRGAAQGTARKEVFAGRGAVKGDQYAELVWLPINGNTLRLCWQVIVISKTRGEGFLLVVDAETGEVVVRRCLTNYISPATYNVYTSDSPSPFSPGHPTPLTVQPPLVNRQLVVTPALNTNASPDGWIPDNGNETRGNNVDAHTDRNDDDQADAPRPVGNPNRVFDFPLDLTMDPTTYSNAAIVNLFYWNNFIHDKLWELGFTEAAGNFQSNNFARGGLGGDAVSADAQDGGGFNNANMLTLPDGIPPRMQMYLFDGPTPDRDGDLDAEIILHEYTHGLSNRRVGNGVGIFQLQPAGMGEGWSDFYGLALLAESTDALDGNWATGGYATFDFFGLFENYYYGVRRYPYSTNLSKNPLTFKDIDPTKASPHSGIPRNPIFGPFTPFDAPEVHNQGEVWCVTLWEIRANLIGKYGFTNGNQLTLQLVTDAMALCPPNPNFLQSRDAILLADRLNNNNANYNELWKAFAKRGMGSSATCPDSSTTIGVFESFDFPGLSISTALAADGTSGNGNGAIDPNECVELFIRLRNNSVTNATSVSATLISQTPGVTVVQGASTYPNLPPGAMAQNITPFRIYTSPSFVCGTRVQLTLLATGFAPQQQTTTNTFQLRSGFVSLNPLLLNNNTPVAIPDANTNGVQSIINVSGFSGALGKLNVSLHITHPFVGDLVLELIGPDGTTIALAKNQGAFGDNYGTSCSPMTARTTFDDSAQFPISVANPPYVGTFQPDEPLDVFEGKSGAALNGTWRLRVIDSGPQDVGVLQCWTLGLFPTVCSDGGGPCDSDISVSATASPSPALVNHDLTYTVTVTNNRPFSANAVTFTNVLPPNATYVSASADQGSCSLIGQTVVCNLGTVAGAADAAVTIVLRPTAVGSLTNVFRVASPSVDANPANNVATIGSFVVQATPAFAAAGSQVTAESLAPATGGIEAGETVTVDLALRNIGPVISGNLIATLLEGNGVSAASGPQNYGAIAPGDVGTRPFTFTASGAQGSSISAVLQLQDGVNNLGTATFQFTVGGEVTTENGAPIVINPLGAASPYPSTINVSGVAGVIGNVRITFTKLAHSFPDDIDALLVGPRGQRLILMSDAGGNGSISNRTLIFDGAAGASLPDESGIAAGSYRPTDYNSGTEPGGDVFPAPAPVGSLVSSLAAFNGTDPNGTWSLFIHDDGGGDGGVMAGGWALTINTVAPVNPSANLVLSTVVSPAAVVAGEQFTITLTVVNQGPSNATSVVLTDVVPAGLEYVNASTSQGLVNLSGGVLTANLGSISSGGSATVTIQTAANSTGLRTNSATVSAPSTDLNPDNNSVTSVISVNNAVADVAVRVNAAPEPVFVSSNITFVAVITNSGPNLANLVRFTNRLASGLAFVSVTNTQGACSFSDGVVACDLGHLSANASATVTLIASGASAGTVNNLFAVTSGSIDNAVANNSTNVTTVISPLAPIIIGAGVAITAESPGPANNSLDPGETVTINFGLRNIGTADTTALVATLQAGNGVSAPTAPQLYGALAAGGPTVARPFSFVVSSAAGSTVTATLQLQDGAQNLGTVAFTFTVSTSSSATNGNVIIIPDQGPATTYPSTLAVSGVTGAVSKVTVTVRQLSHTFSEDIDMLLVGPGGQKVMLMSDAGGGNSISGVTLTFDDSGPPLPSSTITSGTYRPTDISGGDIFPAPAPAGPYGGNLAVFNGTSANGTWSLFVFDDVAGDAGRIDGGWTLNIQTAAPVASSADVGVAVAAPSTASGGAITYVVTVANHGPATATGVVLNDALPAGFALSGVSVSQGNYTTGPGSVTANLGTLNVGSSATVTINGSGTGQGTVTNVLTVTASQADPNSRNNSAVAVTSLTAPSLSIRLAGTDAVITWPASAAGYVLESSSSATGPFAPSGLQVTNINGANQVTVPAVGTQFYRLRSP